MSALRPLWWEDTSPYAGEGPKVDPTERAEHRFQAPDLSESVDVCIVGGGFTGLWTAYYLLKGRPDLSVLVLEAEHVGFGASGRNGGWVSSLYPVTGETLAAEHGEPAARAMLATLRATVAEVGRVVRAERIDCGFVQGGMVALARGAAQAARARAEAATAAHWGDDTVWLDADEASARLAASEVHGGTYTPHCARVHPRRLVDGLAAAVREHGGTIAEGQRVESVTAGRVIIPGGQTVRARQVVRATEAWTATLPGLRRRIAPVYSLMVATEPLSAATWEEIGLAEREVFTDHRHVIVYGQRTVDDRIAFGGRGAPYHWRSTIRPEFDCDDTVFDDLRATLRQLLPQIGDTRFTHAWGGPLGIARDWHPSVGYDESAGVGWAGGYVGDGVAAANLAGRTLADLLTGIRSPLTELPWVGHRSPDWEPEPARWLGINTGLRLAGLADAEERVTGRPALLGRALSTLTGH